MLGCCWQRSSRCTPRVLDLAHRHVVSQEDCCLAQRIQERNRRLHVRVKRNRPALEFAFIPAHRCYGRAVCAWRSTPLAHSFSASARRKVRESSIVADLIQLFLPPTLSRIVSAYANFTDDRVRRLASFGHELDLTTRARRFLLAAGSLVQQRRAHLGRRGRPVARAAAAQELEQPGLARVDRRDAVPCW